MGHDCRICDCERPNEAFTGRGHRNHVCNKCQRLPHTQRHKFEQLDELAHFLTQSNISAKNALRLEVLGRSDDPEVRDWATAILEVARHYPRRRRRYVRMVREQPGLLRGLRQLLGDAWWDDLIVDGGLGSDPVERDRHEAMLNPAGLAAALPSTVACPSTATRLSDPAAVEPARLSTVAASGLKQVTIHTDGACQRNPGPGGWAAILRYGTHVKELQGAEDATTNNRMELRAALEALRTLRQRCAVEMVTDSKYLRDGVTRWLARWKANGWKTVERAPVKNRDLWEALDEQCARHEMTWRWIRGHVGHPDNERCDALARAEITRLPAEQVAKMPIGPE